MTLETLAINKMIKQILVIIICLFLEVLVADAEVVEVGDVEWFESNHICIGHGEWGEAAEGSVIVDNGSAFISEWATIGWLPGSSGDLVISGIGSSWWVRGAHIGSQGYGSLYVMQGGVVTSLNGQGEGITIAWSPDSSGEALVSGPGSIWEAEHLQIGYAGVGSLYITNYGLLRADELGIEDGSSSIYIHSNGVLSVKGNAYTSLEDFLGLIDGSDSIRYRSGFSWLDIRNATLGIDYTLSYSSEGYTELTVLDVVPILLGDTNGDGRVDEQDYANLVSQFGGPPGEESADFNSDNFVSIEDFRIMRENFNSVVSSPELDSVIRTSDPVTLIMLIGGFSFLLNRNKKLLRCD